MFDRTYKIAINGLALSLVGASFVGTVLTKVPRSEKSGVPKGTSTFMEMTAETMWLFGAVSCLMSILLIWFMQVYCSYHYNIAKAALAEANQMISQLQKKQEYHDAGS